MENPSDYVSVREFVSLLHGKIRAGRVRQMLRDGQLNAIKPGGSQGYWYVHRDEAARLLAPVGGAK